MVDRENDIETAAAILEQSGVIGLPTETVYGLAARIDREAALKQIFTLKNRPLFDPLIVHIWSRDQIELLVSEWPPIAEFLAMTFWPGPLTLVVRKNEHVHSLITSGLNTVGIRMPRHPVARELLETVGVPLAAPSANQFGKTSPTRAEHVRREFPNDPDLLILEGGQSEVGLESTVVRVTENEIQILRPGMITARDLMNAIKNFHGSRISISTLKDDQSSPGHMQHHYQPLIPLVLIAEDRALTANELEIIAEKLNLERTRYEYLRLHSNPVLAARELYLQLRELAGSEIDFILAARGKDSKTDERWIAIWDRLQKASSLDLNKF